MPYMACSADSDEGFCGHVDTTCKANNICRTCDTFGGMGGKCSEIDYFPNATVAEYGMLDKDVHQIMSEIYARGPVAAAINAVPVLNYAGGIFSDDSFSEATDHVIAIVGWGTDEETGKKYWIIRNSWGQYWGELGYMRLEMGKNLLGIEGEVAWATPGSFTVKNFPCNEDGRNCVIKHQSQTYVDPSEDIPAVQRRLKRKQLRA
mmetsp:Transcript_14569/g.33659  ORF Transcript_14569/g.33659 Transcript_14569/m.33659 type:complete len:205 (-) Transcript_14569:75-689(-)